MAEHEQVRDMMFAQQLEDGSFCHFYPKWPSVRMCGVPDSEIVAVRLVPDSEGLYWCWHDFETNDYSMCWPSLVQLKMCFTYGIEVAEKAKRGIRTQVRVERVGHG